ncbi:conserved hypothetical protein [Histoplasma capsulatum var. duboisii H88]|uniref:Uncharacterized protein n=1 Tax=Ajellomyces capsulatus (strain H88) TaxID=544711 RepID=F0UNR2_AJEC8|nr:conserved hypothetical protein [Histoplasma capsulatum var. duboisii H88]QSS52989.1 hypothetical protein I7I53_00097 [Histoplasma capsulatum var. duboisii H88]
MTGNSSKVGTRGLYAIGDQTNSPRSEAIEAKRNRDHPPLSSRRGSRHLKEQYLAKNGSTLTDEDLAKLDPTAPAKMHGHKPSRGAIIDAELRAEDEERLRQKGYE